MRAEIRRHVRDVDHDHRTRQRRRIDRRAQPLQREHRRVLLPMDAGGQRQDRARLCAVDDRDRDGGALIAAPRGATSSVPDAIVPAAAVIDPTFSGSCASALKPSRQQATWRRAYHLRREL